MLAAALWQMAHLIYGHDGFAGELGHTIVIPDGRIHAGTGKKVLWKVMRPQPGYD